MEHTKEPWKSEKNGIYGDDGNAALYAACGDALRASSEANARRIVACVNACAGIPTEQLEAIGQLSETGFSLNGLANLKQQRDMLQSQANALHQVAGALGYKAGDDVTRAPWSVAGLVRQRDELAAALKWYAVEADEWASQTGDVVGTNFDFDGGRKAREALAKVSADKTGK